MMRPLLRNELLLIARLRCYRTVLLGYLLAVSSAGIALVDDLLARGGSDPATDMTRLLPAITTLQGIMLAGLTPWAILRAAGPEGSEAMRRSIARTGSSPWQMMLARTSAAGIYVGVLLTLSLPLLFTARLLGAAEYRELVLALADTYAMLLLLALSVFHFMLGARGWIATWILSYVTAACLLGGWEAASAALGHASGALLCLMLIVILGTSLVFRANRRLVYLGG